MQRPNDQAGLHIVRYDRMATLAALVRPGPRLETEPAHPRLGLRGVADVAIGGEDGQDLGFEGV